MLPQKILAAAFSALNLVNEAVIYIRVTVYNTQDIKTIQGKVMSVKCVRQKRLRKRRLQSQVFATHIPNEVLGWSQLWLAWCVSARGWFVFTLTVELALFFGMFVLAQDRRNWRSGHRQQLEIKYFGYANKSNRYVNRFIVTLSPSMRTSARSWGQRTYIVSLDHKTLLLKLANSSTFCSRARLCHVLSKFSYTEFRIRLGKYKRL